MTTTRATGHCDWGKQTKDSRFLHGFTLVELLVVFSIIGVLIALLLPAIQAAREAARRTQCQNNLKQIALAVHAYHDTYGTVPALYNGEQNPQVGYVFGLLSHSWRAELLPFLEQQNLYETIDFSQNATHNRNQPAIKTVVSTFNCPSTPDEFSSARVARSLWIGGGQFDDTLEAATTDYNASEGIAVNGQTCYSGGWGEAIPALLPWRAPQVREVSFKDFTDGLTNTILVVERAGLPDRYSESGTLHEPHQPPQGTWGNVGLWAISAEMMLNHLTLYDDTSPINHDNLTGIFSFHPGGAHVAMGDGAILFLDETIDNKMITALVTRNGGELIRRDDIP